MAESLGDPLTFQRVVRARAAGCIAYLLLVPAFAVVAGVIGGLLGYGLGSLLGAGETLQSGLILSFTAIGMVGAAVGGVWDYRRRAADRIVVHTDRIECFRGTLMDELRFEDIDWIEGPSLRDLKVKATHGRRIRWRVEEWPVVKIGDALVDRAVPEMARRMSERMDQGETVEFRPANLLAVRLLIAGLLCVGISGLLLYLQLTKDSETKTYGRFAIPIFLMGCGTTALVQVARAGGGILVNREGVRRRKADPTLPWDRIRRVECRVEGLTLHFGEGTKPLTLGSLARNYHACIAVLRPRVPPEAMQSPPKPAA